MGEVHAASAASVWAYLPISPHISPYLPISRCRLGVGAQLAEALERFLQRRQDVRLQRLRRRRRCLGVRRQTREPALGKRKLQPRDLVGRAVVHHVRPNPLQELQSGGRVHLELRGREQLRG